MSRDRFVRGTLVAGLCAAAAGISLYATNSPHRTLAHVVFWVGVASLVASGVLNRRAILAYLHRRSARYGLDTAVKIIAFISIIAVVQALSSRYNVRYDVTRNKRFSLAEQTVSVLDSLRRDIDVYAFFRRGTPDEARARDLLDQFRHRTDRFDFEFIDPDRRPQQARDMEVYAFGTTVVESGARRETLARLSEESLLNAVVKVSRETAKIVCFVKGHGERDPSNDSRDGYSIAVAAMEREGFDVRSVALFDVASVPDGCALVVVAGPKEDYLESEIGKINEYLDRGGSALFLIDPHTSLPNIDALLARFGIRVNEDAVVDPFSRVFGTDYSVPVVAEYENHPITRGLELATFYPSARSVAIIDDGIEGVAAQYLAKTGKSAWGETNLELIDKGKAAKDDEDNPGPAPLAVIAQKKPPILPVAGADRAGVGESAVVVFGDADFASNSSFRMSGNSDLFLNVIDFLTGEEELIAVRPKKGLGDRLFLTASQGRLIFLVSVVLLPLAVLACGTAAWAARRRRG